MRSTKRFLIAHVVAGVLLFLGAGVVNAQKVTVGADPGVDLTKYKTYAWAQDKASPNPIISQMIISSVEAQLTAKGLKRVDTDPDLTVVVFGSTESDVHASNPSWAPSLNSINTGVVSGSQSFLVTKGTLVIDLEDSKTKTSVWRGQATQTLEHGPTGDRARDAKMVEKPIRNAVTKMFKQFPHPKRK
jgi:uncharacterized protein DUF4136